MVASIDTVKRVLEAGDQPRHQRARLRAIVEDLRSVPGNKSFRDTVERMARTVSRDGDAP